MKKEYVRPYIIDRNVNLQFFLTQFVSRLQENSPNNTGGPSAETNGVFGELHHGIGFDNTWGEGTSGL